jgi:hypothetical protein
MDNIASLFFELIGMRARIAGVMALAALFSPPP